MVSSAMGLKLGIFGFLSTTDAKTKAKQKRPRSSHPVYLYAQNAVDAGDIRTWRTTLKLTTGKTQRHPIWAPCWNQDGAGSGVSHVYICWYTNNECLWVQWYKYFHEVKDEMFHSTRRSRVEWNISSFTKWKYLFHCTNEKTFIICFI